MIGISEIDKVSNVMNRVQHPTLKQEAIQTTQSIELQGILEAATSQNTRFAYQYDVNHYIRWGGQLPATPEQISAYLQAFAKALKPQTLKRHLIALHHWHVLKEVENPIKSPLVQKTMKGISRLYGTPAEKAAALSIKDLDNIAAYLERKIESDSSIFATRDLALILLGFYGACRRSELASLTWDNIAFVEEGIVLHFPKSKTDQFGEGLVCSIPVGNLKHCPLQALLAWRKASGFQAGPVFRRLSKSSKVLPSAITGNYINQILKAHAVAANIPNAPQISAHSLRRGFATQAFRNGASLQSIKQHGRWRSLKSVLGYLDEGRLFVDSPVNALFGQE